MYLRGMGKFLTTNIALESRETVKEKDLFKQEVLKHEKAVLTLELIGSGDTTNITTEQLLEAIMTRLQEIP